MNLKYLAIAPLVCMSATVFSGAVINYRPDHAQICHKVNEHEILCGNFQLASTLASVKYRYLGFGDDVLNSFSAANHPGDYPFLRKLAMALGYLDDNANAVSNRDITSWTNIDNGTKTELLDRYGAIATTDEYRKILSSYIGTCLDYWSHSDAQYDDRDEPPTLADVSALCIAHSGVLDKNIK